MLNIDSEIMDFKLRLRAISKPGDNLWKLDEPFSESIQIESSEKDKDNNECCFQIRIAIAKLDHQKIYVTYEAFDDCGEWEFRKHSIQYHFNSMDIS